MSRKIAATGLMLVAVISAAVAVRSNQSAATHVLALHVVAPAVASRAPWEANSVQEPNVWHQDGQWQMIFSGGWNTMAVGHATAPTVDGPWTQDSQPVLGLGHGGWAGDAHEPSLLIDHGTLYVYFSPTTEPGSPHACDLMVATGRDARHLHVLPQPALRPFGDAKAIVNVSVVRAAGNYRMLFESRIATAATWAIGYAVGTSPTAFVPVTFPLPSLQRGHGAYGGPDLHRTASGWTVIYHAAVPATTLPTDIYRASSTDLVHWTRGPRVVEHPAGMDQVADPFMVGGRLFYSVTDNPRQRGAIQATHT